MIGGRWDDAMDDLRGDEFELNNEIRELEKYLKQLGTAIPPWKQGKHPYRNSSTRKTKEKLTLKGMAKKTGRVKS